MEGVRQHGVKRMGYVMSGASGCWDLVQSGDKHQDHGHMTACKTGLKRHFCYRQYISNSPFTPLKYPGLLLDRPTSCKWVPKNILDPPTRQSNPGNLTQSRVMLRCKWTQSGTWVVLFTLSNNPGHLFQYKRGLKPGLTWHCPVF